MACSGFTSPAIRSRSRTIVAIMPQFYSIIGRPAAMPAAGTSLRRSRRRVAAYSGSKPLSIRSHPCAALSAAAGRGAIALHFSPFPACGEREEPALKAREGEGLLLETGHEI